MKVKILKEVEIDTDFPLKIGQIIFGVDVKTFEKKYIKICSIKSEHTNEVTLNNNKDYVITFIMKKNNEIELSEDRFHEVFSYYGPFAIFVDERDANGYIRRNKERK